MLRKILLNFKLKIPEIPSDQLFSDYMDHYDPGLERCPSCGAVGQCKRHGFYERGLLDVIDGQVAFRPIRILRVKCACKHTHGVLPDFLVPYRQYSLPFILHVLRLHFSCSMTVADIFENYGFPHSTLYRWKDIFLHHLSWWFDAVTFAALIFSDLVDRLLEENPFSKFLCGFYGKTLYSFLQSHANPANCCRMPPGGLPRGGGTT